MNVLITDDMYTNRLRMSVILKSLGHTYDHAVDGEDAIIKIITNNYDLVLLDIEMPVRNGFETVQYIRQNLKDDKKNIPVIITSSHGSLSYFRDYSSYGYNGVLTKPFTTEKIEQLIAEIFNPQSLKL
ncbi:MAG: response regulator [Bacteroidota bacterium]